MGRSAVETNGSLLFLSAWKICIYQPFHPVVGVNQVARTRRAGASAYSLHADCLSTRKLEASARFLRSFRESVLLFRRRFICFSVRKGKKE